jgi:hypothetical protein
MSIFEVVEDGEEELLETPKGLLNRKSFAPVLYRARATTSWVFGWTGKLRGPPCPNFPINFAYELSEAVCKFWN